MEPRFSVFISALEGAIEENSQHHFVCMTRSALATKGASGMTYTLTGLIPVNTGQVTYVCNRCICHDITARILLPWPAV